MPNESASAPSATALVSSALRLFLTHTLSLLRLGTGQARNVPKTTAASAAHLDSSPLLTGRSVLNQQTSLWRAQRVAGPWRVLQLGLLVSSCVSESYKVVFGTFREPNPPLLLQPPPSSPVPFASFSHTLSLKTTAASAAHLDSSPLLTGRSVLNQQTSLWRAQRVAGPWRVRPRLQCPSPLSHTHSLSPKARNGSSFFYLHSLNPVKVKKA
jgi:hypothetical protein